MNLKIVVRNHSDLSPILEDYLREKIERLEHFNNQEVFDVEAILSKEGHQKVCELITRLKKIRPSLPVIMITGYATVETAVQALRYGVDDYVTKPFNIDELRKVIARSLQSATMQQQKQELAEQLQNAGAELARCRKLAEDQCVSVIRMLVAKVEAKRCMAPALTCLPSKALMPSLMLSMPVPKASTMGDISASFFMPSFLPPSKYP